jgi:hypothetical protein
MKKQELLVVGVAITFITTLVVFALIQELG